MDSKNTDIQIIDRIYSEREYAERAINFVFGFYYEKEQVEKNITLTEQEKKKRKSIYQDALLKGYDPIITTLSEGIYEIEDSVSGGVRKYKLESDKVVWKLEPTSSDPFVRASFHERVERAAQETQGESSPLSDPWIIHEMMEKGFKEQDMLHQEFVSTHEKMLRAFNEHKVVIEHLPSVRSTFNALHNAYNQINQSTKPENTKESIIHELASNPSLITIVNEAKNMIHDIERIHDLFIGEVVVEIIDKNGVEERVSPTYVSGRKSLNTDYLKKTIRVPDNRRDSRINSLVVELFTNPEILNKVSSVRYPKTTQDNISKLYHLCNSIHESVDTNATYNLGFLVYSHLNKIQLRLNEIFNYLNIDPTIGYEYIHNITMQVLKNLPGYDYIEEPNLLKSFFELEVDPIEEFKHNRARKFMSAVLNGRYIESTEMKNDEEEDRERKISIILSDPYYREEFYVNIRQLFSSCRLRYNGGNFVFEVNQNKRKKEPEWVQNVRVMLLSKIRDQVHNENDEELDNVISTIVLEHTLRSNLQLEPYSNTTIGDTIITLSGNDGTDEELYEEVATELEKHTIKQLAANGKLGPSDISEEIDTVIKLLTNIVNKRENLKNTLKFFDNTLVLRLKNELRERVMIHLESLKRKQQAHFSEEGSSDISLTTSILDRSILELSK